MVIKKDQNRRSKNKIIKKNVKNMNSFINKKNWINKDNIKKYKNI